MSSWVAEMESILPGGVETHAPVALEGAKLEATLRPESREALAASLRVSREHGKGLLIVGGSTELSFANAPCTACVRLDTVGIRTEREIDLEEGVALLPAGETVRSVQAELAGSSFELPFDAAGPEATIGGVVASARLGFRYGPPRDHVLGMLVALPSGELVRFGGRVVKNVTGYDLNKLFTGSFGSLGVIVSVWVRLQPVPERVAFVAAPADGHEPAALLQGARGASVRAAVVASSILHFEVAGDEAAVEHDVARLRTLGGEVSSDDAFGGLEEARHGGPFRVRVTGRPTRWAEVSQILAAGGGVVIAEPARGIVRGTFALDDQDERSIADAWNCAREASRCAGGPFAIEAASVSARYGREVYGAVGATAPLQRAIKSRYDPAGILNPGRFVGNA